MYDLLKDENELLKFYERIVPPLAEGEVFYVSLSVRGKYMKGQPKNFHKRLGASEMFERKIIRERDWNKFVRTIKKYCCADGAYTFDDGAPIPLEAMAVYWNVNPSSMLKATSEFGQKMMRSLVEVSLGQGSSLDYLKHLDREILSCLHRAQGTRHYVDIDVDMKEGTKYTANGHIAVAKLMGALQEKGVKFFLIDTRSGYHILMKKDSISFDYKRLLDDTMRADGGQIFDDLMTNHNRMIPLPGTTQGGHLVRVHYELSNYL